MEVFFIDDKFGIEFDWKGADSGQDFDKCIKISPDMCGRVFRSCCITVDGFVTYCDDLIDQREYEIGDLNKN